MEIFAIIIIFLAGWIASKIISKHFEGRYQTSLHDIFILSEQASELESKIKAQIEEVISRVNVPKYSFIDLDDLVLADRSIVYTKQPISTYYNKRSGKMLSIPELSSTLIVTKREIDFYDLETLLANTKYQDSVVYKAQGPEEREEEKEESKKKILPFSRIK